MLYQSEPLYRQVYAKIKKSILNGEISPGSKIVVAELAKTFKISRTPLREALRQLQKEGLLVLDNTGTRVIELNRKDFYELCFCRLILEKRIITLVVNEIPDEQLDMIDSIIHKLEKSVVRNEILKVLSLNTDFHEIIINACENKRLVNLLKQVRYLLLLYRAEINKVSIDHVEILKEHKIILKALKDRDVDRAEQAIVNHLNNDYRRGEKILNSEGVSNAKKGQSFGFPAPNFNT